MTAKDFIKEGIEEGMLPFSMRGSKSIEFVMIKFAQYHVEKALKAANERDTKFHNMELDYLEDINEIILEAYPITNIK